MPPIRWLNYVDNGDPVGFELDTARWWMAQHGYDRVFSFTPNDDYYFTRYPVPGKAHTDYWDDPDVFQHFIMNVVAPPQTRDDPPPPRRREELKNGPRQRTWARITSYVVAYLIPLVAVFAAAYFLAKGIEQHLDPAGDTVHAHFFRNLLALGGLLAGVTVWLRLTQLVRSWEWHAVGVLVFAATARLFYVLAMRTDDLDWLNTLPSLLGDPWTDPRNGLLLVSAALIGAVMLANARWVRRVWTLLFPNSMSLGAVAVPLPQPASSSSSSEKKAAAVSHHPLFRNTLRVMLVLGGLALGVNAVAYAALHPSDHAPFWPLVLAAAAFLYLWRLSALVFDLVFIWHRYIRHSGVMNFLRHSILPPAAETASPAAGGRNQKV